MKKKLNNICAFLDCSLSVPNFIKIYSAGKKIFIRLNFHIYNISQLICDKQASVIRHNSDVTALEETLFTLNHRNRIFPLRVPSYGNFFLIPRVFKILALK